MSARLHQQVKTLILEAVNLSDLAPESLADDEPLFPNERLQLDSVDALEIVVALQRRFGVRLDDRNLARQILASPDSIVQWLRSQGVTESS